MIPADLAPLPLRHYPADDTAPVLPWYMETPQLRARLLLAQTLQRQSPMTSRRSDQSPARWILAVQLSLYLQQQSVAQRIRPETRLAVLRSLPAPELQQLSAQR